MDKVFLLLFSGLYPAMFLMSRNWFMYSGSQIAFALIVTPLLALMLSSAVGFALLLFLRSLGKFAATQSIHRLIVRHADAIQTAIFAMLSCVVILFLLQATIQTLVPSRWLFALGVFVVMLLTVTFVTRKGLRALRLDPVRAQAKRLLCGGGELYEPTGTEGDIQFRQQGDVR